MRGVLLIFICFTLFSTLGAQETDSVKSSQTQYSNKLTTGYNTNPKLKAKQKFTRKESFPVVFGALGFIVGFVAMGQLTGYTVIAIKGNDENQISQIGALVGCVLGAYGGAKLGVWLATEEEDVSLQVAPIYDLENNGIGMGVSMQF